MRVWFISTFMPTVDPIAQEEIDTHNNYEYNNGACSNMMENMTYQIINNNISKSNCIT